MRPRARFALLASALLGAAATAPPPSYEKPHPELPSPEQPARTMPVRGYTLALSWAPEFCHARRGDRAVSGECADRATRGGFILHGLWPDGDGPNRWPQYCRPVPILTDRQIAAGIGATPSAQLLQHEWARHGSCMYGDPIRYFADEDRIYAAFHTPEMAALATRRDLTVMEVQSALAAANPGLRATMLRLNLTRNGWLSEVWVCLGLDKRPQPCPASAGGARPGQRVRIQAPF